MPEVSEKKKTQIVAYRNKKNLCNECGCVQTGDPHICYENYVKADMRDKDLPTENVIEVRHIGMGNIKVENTTDLQTYDPTPELTARMKTIVSYRDRKSLCSRCGTCDVTTEHECKEDYTEADRRPEQDKLKDPRTVVTPKETIPSISDIQKDAKVAEKYIQLSNNDFFKLGKSADIQAQRKFIVIDITKSPTNQKISMDFIKFMSGKYKNFIIYLIGDIEKSYSYKEYLELKKMQSVCPIKNIMDQNIINHLHGCQRFFGFPSKYATYCLTHALKSTVFFDNSEKFNIPCTIVDIKNDQDVNIDILKTNVSSWKV